MEATDHELVRLLRDHGDVLYATTFRIVLRHDVADDVLQELFLRLRESSSFFEAKSRLAFAKRVAINLSLDWRRRVKSNRADSLDTQSGEPSCDFPARDADLKRVEQRDLAEWILSEIDKLPQLQQEVLVLRYVEGLEHSEIAQLTEKTEHQIRGLASKAIQKLRRTLPDREID